MSFWKNATDEQKLAQIDGGIECNLTIRQIAMNCGATSPAVAYFGRKHGRSFPAKYSSHAACKRAISVRTIITSRAARVPNLLMKDAFSIFGTDGDGEEVIFDVR